MPEREQELRGEPTEELRAGPARELESQAGPGSGGCLHELFATQAARSPERVAVSFRGQSLSYRELDLRASRLAERLRAQGVAPKVLVGVLLERSCELVVALLAVAKAGGAALPLDPQHPPERLATLLEDARAPVLVTRRRLAQSLPAHAGSRLLLDEDERPLSARAVAASGEARPESLAYVIYTSGSTGRPKGVLVEHRSAVRLFAATQPWFRFGPSDVWTLFHSVGFDFSVWEIWGALLHGGRLVVVPAEVARSPGEFHELLCAEGVTVLNQTPSAFRQLVAVDAERLASRDLALRLVILGGEALDPKLLRPWFDRHGDESPTLVNMYGITETTVHATLHRLRAADLADPRPGSPIGRPLPDLEILLLDENGQRVPAGMPGEIYVGGPGVARGYLRRPEETRERFLPDPRSGAAGARLYRSGDLARAEPDGSLRYLGRIDDQLKILGHRVEPGEVEACLREDPGVADAAVVAREVGPGDLRLFAWVVARADAEGGELLSRLRQLAARRLPAFLQPASFALLPRLPLTLHGKADRGRLRELARDGVRRAREPEASASTASLLAELFAEVLAVPRVGAEDDFFDLGGDSLKAVLLFGRIEERFGIQLALDVLAQGATLAHLSQAIDRELARADAARPEKAAR